MGLEDAKNKVPHHQRFYQTAYRQHQRLWQINPRSRWYMTPLVIAMWGTLACNFYVVGRKIAGHNTWFSKD